MLHSNQHAFDTTRVGPWLHAAASVLARDLVVHFRHHSLVGLPADRFAGHRCSAACPWALGQADEHLDICPVAPAPLARRAASPCGFPLPCENAPGWASGGSAPACPIRRNSVALSTCVAHQGLPPSSCCRPVSWGCGRARGTVAALPRGQGDTLFQQVFVDVRHAAAGNILSNS